MDVAEWDDYVTMEIDDNVFQALVQYFSTKPEVALFMELQKAMQKQVPQKKNS